MLGDLFNTVVDIATAPVKLGAKIVDDVIESDIESYVDELRDTLHID